MRDAYHKLNSKNAILVFLLASAIGVVYGSSNFFISRTLKAGGFEYHPAISENFDETMYYHPRVAAAYRGDWLVGDFSVVEYKEGPTTLAMLNPVIVGLLGRATGSFESGLMAANIIFPILIFIALYFLIFEIAPSKRPASFFATILMFSPLFAMKVPPTSFSAVKELFYDFFPLFGGVKYFHRLEYPQATYLFYVIALYFILRAIKMKNWSNIIFAGTSFGILFYTYFYDWTYLAAGLFIMFLLFIFQKKYAEAKVIVIFFLIGLVVSSLYWINLLELYKLPQFDDIVSRMGNEVSHQFRFWTVWKSYFRIIVLSLLLWFFARKKEDLASNYLISFLSAYFIAVNVQVILGFNPQPDHWYRELFLITALSFILILHLFLQKYAFRIKFRKPLRACFGVFLVLFLGLQLRAQYLFSLANAKQYTYSAENAKSYDWLNKNTQKNAVIGSFDAGINNQILLFTHNKTFLPSGFISLAPTEEIWERAMVLAKIFGVGGGNLVKSISENHFYLFADQYRRNAFDAYFGGGDRIVPANIYNNKLGQYSKLELDKVFKKYKLDYLYYMPEKSAPGGDPINALPHIRKIYEQNGIIIYKL